MPEMLMAMLIVRYQEADRVRWGRLAGNAPTHASDVVLVEPIICDAITTGELLSELESPRSLATTAATQIPASRLLSPVTDTLRHQTIGGQENRIAAPHLGADL
jgi:hypothetical protein